MQKSHTWKIVADGGPAPQRRSEPAVLRSPQRHRPRRPRHRGPHVQTKVGMGTVQAVVD